MDDAGSALMGNGQIFYFLWLAGYCFTLSERFSYKNYWGKDKYSGICENRTMTTINIPIQTIRFEEH